MIYTVVSGGDVMESDGVNSSKGYTDELGVYHDSSGGWYDEHGEGGACRRNKVYVSLSNSVILGLYHDANGGYYDEKGTPAHIYSSSNHHTTHVMTIMLSGTLTLRIVP